MLNLLSYSQTNWPIYNQQQFLLGADKIIYLPENSIVLNGNLSTDDHAITTWEWTKSADNTQKAVDMQDTRTPYLKLSNLVEGIYTFTLKVTDSANQSSTAQVSLYSKYIYFVAICIKSLVKLHGRG